jgi:carboxyl-terminal processing protease
LRLTTASIFSQRAFDSGKGYYSDIIVELEITAERYLSIREKTLITQRKTARRSREEGSTIPAYDRRKFKDDYQMLRALDLLKGWEILKSMQKTR